MVEIAGASEKFVKNTCKKNLEILKTFFRGQQRRMTLNLISKVDKIVSKYEIKHFSIWRKINDHLPFQ